MGFGPPDRRNSLSFTKFVHPLGLTGKSKVFNSAYNEQRHFRPGFLNVPSHSMIVVKYRDFIISTCGRNPDLS